MSMWKNCFVALDFTRSDHGCLMTILVHGIPNSTHIPDGRENGGLVYCFKNAHIRRIPRKHTIDSGVHMDILFEACGT